MEAYQAFITSSRGEFTVAKENYVRRHSGWVRGRAGCFSAGMEAYQAFITSSRGEFTVAKDIYVRPNSGWFSDRAVCYLAVGRPVVTMRTGFSKFYPVGAGLFEFSTMDEALA